MSEQREAGDYGTTKEIPTIIIEPVSMESFGKLPALPGMPEAMAGEGYGDGPVSEVITRNDPEIMERASGRPKRTVAQDPNEGRPRARGEPQPDKQSAREMINARARTHRNGRVLADNLADPGLAEMTLSLSQPEEVESGYQGEPQPDPQQPAPNGEVELTVYGQKLLVNQEDVDRMGGPVEAQKHLAAEAKMRRAAEIERDANETYARAETMQRATRLLDSEIAAKLHPVQGSPNPGAAALPGQPDAASAEESVGLKLSRAIFSGDMDSVAQTLDSALNRSASPDQISATVDQVLEQRKQREQQQVVQQAAQTERERVVQHMHTAHADIVNDPLLNAAAKTAFKMLREQNPRASLLEITDAAAQSVRSRFQPAQQPAQQPDAFEQRRQAKQGMSWTAPAGAASAPAAAPQQTRSSIVTRMRESRGLPT